MTSIFRMTILGGLLACLTCLTGCGSSGTATPTTSATKQEHDHDHDHEHDHGHTHDASGKPGGGT